MSVDSLKCFFINDASRTVLETTKFADTNNILKTEKKRFYVYVLLIFSPIAALNYDKKAIRWAFWMHNWIVGIRERPQKFT